jgi:homoserine kinase type II
MLTPDPKSLFPTRQGEQSAMPKVEQVVSADDVVVALENAYGLRVVGSPVAMESYWDFNFRVRTHVGAVFCKAYTHDSLHDAEFHASLIEVLANEGLPVPRVMRARGGQHVTSAAGLPFIVQEFLPGEGVSELPMTGRLLSELGRTLAQIHNAADGRRFRGNQTKITSWDPRQHDLLFARYEGAAERFSPRARKQIEGLRRSVDTRCGELDALPRGIIHGDYHPGNVLGVGQRIVGVIDFSEAINSWIIADLGICLSYLLHDREARFKTVATFLKGYLREGQLSRHERALLPTMIQLRAATRAIECKLDGGVSAAADLELIEFFSDPAVEDAWGRAFG